LARPLRPWMRIRSLGSSASNLRTHKHFGVWVRAVPPSALPRRSLASFARWPCLFNKRCLFNNRWLSIHVSVASLPEVLCPFSGLCRASFTRCFPLQLARLALQVAPLCKAPNTSRVLSPSSRSCTDTCQACSIPAPLMGFCLQRSVHILSRTPLGSPCPAFPWQRS
jgi:hypothetical protein